MRKLFLYFSLGLLSIPWISGCGFFRHCRNDDCTDRHKCLASIERRHAPVSGTGRPLVYAKSAATGKGVAKSGGKAGPIAGLTSKPIPSSSEWATPIDLPPLNQLPMVGEEPPMGGQFPEAAQSSKFEEIPPMLQYVEPTKPSAGFEPAPSGSELFEPAPGQSANSSLESEPMPPPMFPESGNSADPMVVLKSTVIKYGHADNFQSVTGQVQQWRKTWRLRYAPVDQEDQHGGSVILEGSAQLERLRDGQHVRVRGVLVPAQDRQGAARYRVQSIEILD